MIIIGKCPYRVSLLGGSSDLSWFVKEKGFGLCLGFSLNQYSYSVINLLPENAKKGILEYSTRETYSNVNDIVHPIIREVLIDLNLPSFIELKTFGFASGGAGLGGSASFIISLVSSLCSAFELNLNLNEIIEKACFIEINKLNKPIGKQDQYLCANKGFSSFNFYDDNKVKENYLSKSMLLTLRKLVNNFYLIPTYKTRNSDSVLSKIKSHENSLEKILEIRSIASKFISFKDDRNHMIEELFHNSIRDSWEIKKSMSNVMTITLSEQYEEINKLIPNHWIRLVGAGQGGYFLISSKINEKEVNELSNNKCLKGIFKATISDEGASILKV